MSNGRNRRAAPWLYSVAAVIGVTLALVDIIERPESSVDDAAVARVGDVNIPLRRYRELLSDVASDSRQPLTDSDRQFALKRLIDEELLVLRARELGLDDSVPAIRKAMSSAVIAQIVAEATAERPGDAELEAFLQNDPGFFSRTARYTVRWFRLPGVARDDPARAMAIRAHLQRGVLSVAELAVELPREPLPTGTLSTYLGSTLTSVLPELAPGSFSEPVFVRGQWHVLELEARVDAGTPDFEEIAPLVRSEYLKRKSDQALADYLDWLRSRADVDINHRLAEIE